MVVTYFIWSSFKIVVWTPWRGHYCAYAVTGGRLIVYVLQCQCIYSKCNLYLLISYLKHKPVRAHSKTMISEKSLSGQTILPSSVHPCTFKVTSMGLILWLSSLPNFNCFSKESFFEKRNLPLFCYCPFLFTDCPHSLQKFSFLFKRTEGHFRKNCWTPCWILRLEI